MKIYILHSPARKIFELVSEIKNSGNSPVVFNSIWAPNLDQSQINNYLNHEYDITLGQLQVNWRKIENSEWCPDLGHHKIYQMQVTNGEHDEWFCVLEDDVTLCDDFFDRLAELGSLRFSQPTVIQLFSRGKRYCYSETAQKRLHLSLYKADFPPGSACAYLMNISALKVATREEKAKGFADWPYWSKQCNFYLSYPWTVVEHPTDSLLPVYSRSRLSYYMWLLKILSHFDFKRWRRANFTYSDYFHFMIFPWVLRVLFRLRIYRVLDPRDPYSIWVRRDYSFRSRV